MVRYHKMPAKAKSTDFMREAMKCAIRALGHEDVPIGAVIVKDGKIVARGENKVQKKMDPTAHAEVVAIAAACKKLERKFLDDCEIYVTLEPCAMCATAISFARIKKLIYAADDPKGGAINYGAKVYQTDPHLFIPTVEKNDVYSVSSSRLLKGFFKRLRVKNSAKKAGNKPVVTAKNESKKDSSSIRARARSIKEKQRKVAKND